MDARLKSYVERVRAITSSGLAPRSTVQAVQAEAERLFAQGFELEPEQCLAPEQGYGRHLLHEDPETGFVVIAMVWPPHADSRPHDHRTWGVVGVLQGDLHVTGYEREDDGSVPGRARLRPTGELTAPPGAVAHVLPPHDEFHRLANPSDGTTITVHTYGRPIEACTVFDLETGTCEEVHPSYTSTPA